MSSRRYLIMNARLAAAALAGLPATAWAHAFDDRYDLPAPLSYFVAGAAAAVGLSFVVAALVAHRAPPISPAQGRVVALGPLWPALRRACQFASVILFALTVIAGLFGTGDPMMNLAPTMVWIIGWVGLSLVVACFGNIWPALDPWRALYDMMDRLARRWRRTGGISLGWTYPRALGKWPAVGLLLALAWFEVVYPQAAVPYRIACAALAWSGLTLLGMVCFGRAAWQDNADLFNVYFSTLGRFAPATPGPNPRSIALRPPGRGLIATDAGSAAMAGFVIAMLSTVLFDGLLSGQVWWLIQRKLTLSFPNLVDDNGYFLGTIGLVGLWLIFLAAYALTCWITALLVRGRPVATIARLFALTLVPIAVAYNVAHNFSNLLVQGQQLIPLLSDPLGRKWNLLGTATYYPNIGIVDARFTWYVAIGAIVAGHVVSIWLAHRVALREFGAQRKAVLASIPLTILMVIYTAISLSVIAEPMVKFDTPSENSGALPIHQNLGLDNSAGLFARLSSG
jgi:hypothetical protein